jgi:hypothetical protein
LKQGCLSEGGTGRFLKELHALDSGSGSSAALFQLRELVDIASTDDTHV